MAAPLPRVPAGPAPGDPGFGLEHIGGMGSPPPPPPPELPKKVFVLPPGAGQIDTSGVAPKGFASGAVHLPGKLPDGAGQVDLSGVTPSRGEDAAAVAPRQAPTAQGVPGGVYVPGGWQHASRGETRQHGLDPAKLEEGQYFRDVASGQGMLAADKQLEAAGMQARADVAYAKAHEDATRQSVADQRRIENQRRSYIEQEHQKLETLAVAAREKVNPEAAQGGAGAQIFAALAVGLGQFGASLSGGPNAALQIVNANIDRRIAAQQANIANAGRTLDREQSLYRQNLEAFGDRERATLATKMQMLDQAKAMADQQYAASKGVMNEAQYHSTIEGLNNSKAAAADRFAAATSDQVSSSTHDAYQRGGIIGGASTHEAKVDAKGYSEALEKANIPKSLAGLQDVDQRLDALGDGDIAGVGTLKNHVPALLLSKEGVANRQAVAHIKNALRKDVAGASLTPGEKAELDKDLEGAGDAASLRNFVQSYRRSLSTQQKSIAAGFSPEGRNLYHQRGGSVQDIETNKRTTPYQRPVKDDEK